MQVIKNSLHFVRCALYSDCVTKPDYYYFFWINHACDWLEINMSLKEFMLYSWNNVCNCGLVWQFG